MLIILANQLVFEIILNSFFAYISSYQVFHTYRMHNTIKHEKMLACRKYKFC